MSVLYIRIFLCANIEIGCCVYQNFNVHAVKIKKVISVVFSRGAGIHVMRGRRCVKRRVAGKKTILGEEPHQLSGRRGRNSAARVADSSSSFERP